MERLPHTEDTAPEGIERLADTTDRIEGYFRHFVELPYPTLYPVLALWTLNTYTFQLFDYCPYLVLSSSGPGAGKSKLLELLSLLCAGNPQPITDPSAAALYRCPWPVFLLDEMERLGRKDKSSRGNYIEILNSGYKRNSCVARADRTKEGAFPEKKLSIYGPKAFAGINALNDTLTHRSFTIRMKPYPGRKPRLSERTFGETAKQLRNLQESWVTHNKEAVEGAYIALPTDEPVKDLESFDSRYQDISEPLIVLAELADAERPEGPLVRPRLVEGLRTAYKDRAKPYLAALPKTVFEIIAGHLGDKDNKYVPSQILFEECQKSEKLPWIRTKKGLAQFLKRFGLSPREGPDGKRRGYLLTKEWVEDHKGSTEE